MLELNQCYNMDCMKGMAQFPDGFFDLAVVDPPYFSGPERRGYYGSKVSKIGVYRDYPVSPVWEIPGRAYFDELRRVAKHSPALAAMDGNQAAIFDEMKKAIDETLEELSDYRVAFAVEDTADERTEEK